jgi:uncharacterized protein (DUF302 family)
MKSLAIRREVKGKVDEIVEKVTNAIKPCGFGILTRIDFDQKMKEKLGETIPRTVVLGACNPRLAFDAYQQMADVTLFIPCNIVVRETSPGQVVIEAMRPSAMLTMLPAVKMEKAIETAEQDLESAILNL